MCYGEEGDAEKMERCRERTSVRRADGGRRTGCRPWDEEVSFGAVRREERECPGREGVRGFQEKRRGETA